LVAPRQGITRTVESATTTRNGVMVVSSSEVWGLATAIALDPQKSTTPNVLQFYPGASGLARLDAYAGMWEEVRLQSLRLRYISNSGTMTAGKVVMGVDFDPADTTPASPYGVLLGAVQSLQPNLEGPMWQSMEMRFSKKELDQANGGPGIWRYTSGAAKHPDRGAMFALNLVTTSTECGLVRIDYTVEFRSPRSGPEGSNEVVTVGTAVSQYKSVQGGTTATAIDTLNTAVTRGSPVAPGYTSTLAQGPMLTKSFMGDTGTAHYQEQWKLPMAVMNLFEQGGVGTLMRMVYNLANAPLGGSNFHFHGNLASVSGNLPGWDIVQPFGGTGITYTDSGYDTNVQTLFRYNGIPTTADTTLTWDLPNQSCLSTGESGNVISSLTLLATGLRSWFPGAASYAKFAVGAKPAALQPSVGTYEQMVALLSQHRIDPHPSSESEESDYEEVSTKPPSRRGRQPGIGGSRAQH